MPSKDMELRMAETFWFLGRKVKLAAVWNK